MVDGKWAAAVQTTKVCMENGSRKRGRRRRVEEQRGAKPTRASHASASAPAFPDTPHPSHTRVEAVRRLEFWDNHNRGLTRVQISRH